MKTIDLYNKLEAITYTPSVTELAIQKQKTKIAKVPDWDGYHGIDIQAVFGVATLSFMGLPIGVLLTAGGISPGLIGAVFVIGGLIIVALLASLFALPSIFNAVRRRRESQLAVMRQYRYQEFTAWVEENHDITLDSEHNLKTLTFNDEIRILDEQKKEHIFKQNDQGAYMLIAPKTFNQTAWIPQTKQRKLTSQMERLESKINLLKGKKLNAESQHAVQRVKSDYQELLTLQEELGHQTKLLQQTFVNSVQQLEEELDAVAAQAYHEAEKRYLVHNNYIQDRNQRKLILS